MVLVEDTNYRLKTSRLLNMGKEFINDNKGHKSYKCRLSYKGAKGA